MDLGPKKTAFGLMTIDSKLENNGTNNCLMYVLERMVRDGCADAACPVLDLSVKFFQNKITSNIASVMKLTIPVYYKEGHHKKIIDLLGQAYFENSEKPFEKHINEECRQLYYRAYMRVGRYEEANQILERSRSTSR